MEKKIEVIGEAEIGKLINQLSESVARAINLENLAIIGIRRRGVELALRLQKRLEKSGRQIPLGILDITLYRDDLSSVDVQPLVRGTSIPFDLTGRDILLVDDVLYTGRTIRAALTQLVDFGRPRSVKLLTLIDRDHRELPIQPDFTGRFVEAAAGEFIEVRLREVDGEDKVLLIARPDRAS